MSLVPTGTWIIFLVTTTSPAAGSVIASRLTPAAAAVSEYRLTCRLRMFDGALFAESVVVADMEFSLKFENLCAP
jgi:hypothetical protein